jgi:hypothetical protein
MRDGDVVELTEDGFRQYGVPGRLIVLSVGPGSNGETFATCARESRRGYPWVFPTKLLQAAETGGTDQTSGNGHGG